MSAYRGITEGEIRAKYSEEVQELKRKIASRDKLIEEYKSSHGGITTLFDAIKDTIPIYPPEKIEYKKTVGKKGISCGVCLLICDTHYGAVQVSSEIEGFGDFSPEICETRSMKFIDEVINWTSLQRSNYLIDKAHVLVAGDLISGDIHEELRVTNAFPVTQQVIGTARLLSSQISALQSHFAEVNVHFIVADNHSRLTKKPQAKEEGINSFNYLVGAMAQVMLCQHNKVKFNIYPQYEAVVNVEGRKYLLLHGHNIMGWMGVPWYSIERKVAREAIKRFNKPDFTRFDKVIMGHWHQAISTPYYWIGGSVSGTDAYDHKNGRHSEPSQSSWLVHPKHGEFSRIDWKL